MLFNIFSLIGLVITVMLFMFIKNNPKGFIIVKMGSVFLLVVKSLTYFGYFYMSRMVYPIEISTITYFLFSIITLFKIRKIYHIASFFAIISGIGFFIYYSLFGFISFESISFDKYMIAVLNHGILLLGGLYLLYNFDFSDSIKYHIIIGILLIIAHASIFYFEDIKGTTFIYYLIRPEFISVTSNLYLNHLLKYTFYIVLYLIFIVFVNSFYYINAKIIYFKKVNQTLFQQTSGSIDDCVIRNVT